jgi:hypothetical protein
MQCFCYDCAGEIVSRQTFRIHGRKEKPDAPLRDMNQEMISMQPDGEDNEAGSTEEDSMPEEDSTTDDNTSDDDDGRHNPLLSDNEDEEDEDEEEIGRGKLTKTEVTRSL